MSCSLNLHLSITLESYLSHLVGYLFPLVVRHHIALTVPTLLLLPLSVRGLSLVMGPVRTQKQFIHSSYWKDITVKIIWDRCNTIYFQNTLKKKI